MSITLSGNITLSNISLDHFFVDLTTEPFFNIIQSTTPEYNDFRAQRIHTDSNGNMYITCRVRKLSQSNNRYALILKLNASFEILWAKIIGGTNGYTDITDSKLIESTTPSICITTQSQVGTPSTNVYTTIFFINLEGGLLDSHIINVGSGNELSRSISYNPVDNIYHIISESSSRGSGSFGRLYLATTTDFSTGSGQYTGGGAQITTRSSIIVSQNRCAFFSRTSLFGLPNKGCFILSTGSATIERVRANYAESSGLQEMYSGAFDSNSNILSIVGDSFPPDLPGEGIVNGVFWRYSLDTGFPLLLLKTYGVNQFRVSFKSAVLMDNNDIICVGHTRDQSVNPNEYANLITRITDQGDIVWAKKILLSNINSETHLLDVSRNPFSGVNFVGRSFDSNIDGILVGRFKEDGEGYPPGSAEDISLVSSANITSTNSVNSGQSTTSSSPVFQTITLQEDDITQDIDQSSLL